MSVIVAIDPGSASGAIAVGTHNKGELDVLSFVENMPDTPEGILSRLTCLAPVLKPGGVQKGILVIENVGPSHRGNAAHSSYVFAKHRGHLEMACIALGLKPLWLTPQTWLRILFLDNYPKGAAKKAARKTYVHEKMKLVYNSTHFTKQQADAVGLFGAACILLDNNDKRLLQS